MANKGLMEMLKNAKQVMDKAEEKKPLISKHTTTVTETNNVTPNIGLSDTTENVQYLTEEQMLAQAQATQPKTLGINGPKIVNGKGVYENLEKSKIPDVIKKAMVENPIPQLATPNHTFTLEDVSGLVQEQQVVKKQPQRKQISNVVNPKELVGLTESQVVEIVDERIIEFFTKYFAKTLAEDVQQKVLKQVLMNAKKKK